ncbi:Uncharacterised protein [Shigella sonnei]|nr:Uncharacterised protein [Salmonella enterica subsp. enterica serovar Typhimurium str. DT104]CSQ63289.1 Uncharacterised protein [Shigella sonnei]CSS69483.1 Uncharacterised protein [Shigella sonnei]CUA53887.1 Uncharacterised protein [Escherichia coli]
MNTVFCVQDNGCIKSHFFMMQWIEGIPGGIHRPGIFAVVAPFGETRLKFRTDYIEKKGCPAFFDRHSHNAFHGSV